jgi:hypothetical protein
MQKLKVYISGNFPDSGIEQIVIDLGHEVVNPASEVIPRDNESVAVSGISDADLVVCDLTVNGIGLMNIVPVLDGSNKKPILSLRPEKDSERNITKNISERTNMQSYSDPKDMKSIIEKFLKEQTIKIEGNKNSKERK